MATSILDPGLTAAPASDIVVAAGATVTVGIYSAAAGSLPSSVAFNVMQATPGAENLVATLNNSKRTAVLSGPGTFRVRRPAYAGTAFGVFKEI